MSDLVDRQKVAEVFAGPVLYAVLDGSPEAYINGLTEAYNLICQLPSVQPEPFTDKEKRIFLTAMAREEKVCRQVDDECRDRTPYEVSLVYVCKEIRRKVKGALWT